MTDTDRSALYVKARRHLARRDERLKLVLDSVGPCTLQTDAAGFAVLVRAIVAQLISTAAARTIYGRLESALGPAGVTPASVLALEETRLRGVGLSGAKARSLRDLAER